MVMATTIMIIGALFVNLNVTGGSGIVLVATSACMDLRYRAVLVRQGYILLKLNGIINEERGERRHWQGERGR